MQRNSFLTSLPFCCENGNFSLDLIKKKNNNATQKRGDDGDNPTIYSQKGEKEILFLYNFTFFVTKLPKCHL